MDISDLLIEMSKVIEIARKANDSKDYLKLCYLMGGMHGSCMLIHELSKENVKMQIRKKS